MDLIFISNYLSKFSFYQLIIKDFEMDLKMISNGSGGSDGSTPGKREGSGSETPKDKGSASKERSDKGETSKSSSGSKTASSQVFLINTFHVL